METDKDPEGIKRRAELQQTKLDGGFKLPESSATKVESGFSPKEGVEPNTAQERAKDYTAAEIIGSARHGRTPEEYKALALDPGHNLKREQPGERKVGLEMERRNEIPGPISREASGSADFTDSDGQKWDVKGFRSDHDAKHGGFTLDRATTNMQNEFDKGNNVIVDTRRMDDQHKSALAEEVKKRNWDERTKWYP